MNAYIAGLAIGTIGLLSGAVVAVWYRAQYFKARGRLDVVVVELMVEREDHDRTLNQALTHATEYEDQLDRNKGIINLYRERLDSLRNRQFDDVSLGGVIDIANGLRNLHEDEDSDPVADTRGDDAITLPGPE